MSQGFLSLNSVPPGAEIFIDANIFIYHFTGSSKECADFLIRCEKGELRAITSVVVLAEVMHRLMIIEAGLKRLIKGPNLVKKLKEKPHIIAQLGDYFSAIESILAMDIKVTQLESGLILDSQILRARYGLLVNDSLLLATMRKEGISFLATNDVSFKRIEWLKIYCPTDLPQ